MHSQVWSHTRKRLLPGILVAALLIGVLLPGAVFAAPNAKEKSQTVEQLGYRSGKPTYSHDLYNSHYNGRTNQRRPQSQPNYYQPNYPARQYNYNSNQQYNYNNNQRYDRYDNHNYNFGYSSGCGNHAAYTCPHNRQPYYDQSSCKQDCYTCEARHYRVGNNDTLSSIAKRYHTDVDTLARANNLRNPHRIYVGQLLLIPARTCCR